MKRFITLLLTITLTLASALDLAVRGKPADCSIVIAENATMPYQSAAKELQSFIEQMTDVRLPILRDNGALPAKAIIIGPNRHSQSLLKADYKPETLGDDAYIIKVIGNRIVVLGNKRGGQYGVYDILERFGGCQWYSSWCAKIPKHDKFSVPDNLNLTEKPAFMMREPFWFDMFDTMQAVRNRCNGNAMRLTEDNGGKIAFGGDLFVHTFFKLVPPSEFYATHPEYFSEIDGKRMNGYYQLCLTNPEVKRIVIERMRKIIGESIKRNASAKIFSLSQNDNISYCKCAECNKFVENNGNQTDLLIWFVNQAAEEIAKDYPDVFIETLAYQYTREASKTVRPRENVIVRLCTGRMDFAHPIRDNTDQKAISFVKDIETWANMTDKLFIWDYVTNFAHYVSPCPNFYSLQSNIQLFRDNHVVALMSQGAYQAHHADFAELKGWLGAKLMWNPDIDVNVYLNDFFGMDGYYGAAGPIVRRYFNELHEIVKPKDVHVNLGTRPDDKWIGDDFLLHATDLFNEAEAAVKDDALHLYNVHKAALPVYYMRFARLPKENAKYVWNGMVMEAVNIPPAKRELAREFVTRADEKLNGVARPIRFSEHIINHEKTLLEFKGAAYGLKPQPFEKGFPLLCAIPEMDAMLAIFVDNQAGMNHLAPKHGGIQCTLPGGSTYPTRQFRIIKNTGNEMEMHYFLGRHSDSRTKYTLLDDGTLKAVFTTKCEKAGGLPSAFHRPSFALNLRNESNVCYRQDGGEWKELTANPQFTYECFVIPQKELEGKSSFTIASPKTGHAATISLNAAKVESALVFVYPCDGAAKIVINEKSGIQEGATLTSEYSVKFHHVQGLPASVPSSLDSRRGLRVYPHEITLGHQGEWCRYEPDDESMLGTAILMTNTHHQWCLRLTMSELDLDPALKYKVRIRVKAVARADHGNAFSAGIYDETSKTKAPDVNGTKPDVKELKPGYQWYDLGTYIPNPSHAQWFWGAPGWFDAKKGETSAVEYVMVDCVDFIATEQ